MERAVPGMERDDCTRPVQERMSARADGIPPGPMLFRRRDAVQIGCILRHLPRALRRMDPLIIHLQDRRLVIAERMDLVGHGAAAVGLLAAAVDSLSARPALGAVELVAAGALVYAIRRELRAGEREKPAGISRLNLAAAAVLLVEWYVELRAGGKPFSPELLSAITAGVLAFLHPVIQRRRRERRALRIDDAGITLQTSRFRRFSAAWSELRGVDAGPDALRFVTADGRERRVRLRTIINRAEVVEAVAAAAARMGVGRIPSRT